MNSRTRRVFVTDIPIIEVILSLISSWWAIVFLMSSDLFSEYPGTYAAFSEIAPITWWAVLFIVSALTKVIGIIAHVAWIRKLGLILSAVIYGLISYCYLDSVGWFSIGFGTFFAMSVMALWGVREVKRTNG